MQFYQIDPWGDQRADLRTGIMCATMNNRWRGKYEQPLEPLDFMPYHKIHQAATPEEMQRTLKEILGNVQHG